MTMKPNTLVAAAVAAVLVVPLGAVAQAPSSDIQPPSAGKAAGEKAGGSSGTSGSAGSTRSGGGAEAMFKSLDKNGDGYISKDEAKGTPHEKEFARLDKNSDGKLSREEHAAAPEHKGSSTSGDSSSGSGRGGGLSGEGMKTY
jgi:hypothetical protein